MIHARLSLNFPLGIAAVTAAAIRRSELVKISKQLLAALVLLRLSDEEVRICWTMDLAVLRFCVEVEMALVRMLEGEVEDGGRFLREVWQV